MAQSVGSCLSPTPGGQGKVWHTQHPAVVATVPIHPDIVGPGFTERQHPYLPLPLPPALPGFS